MYKSPLNFSPQKMLASHGLLLFILFLGLTLSFKGPDVVALLASATSSLSGDPAILYFAPYQGGILHVGETAEVDVNVHARVPINAIGTTITFPEDTLEVVGISKAKSFLDLWTEETSIDEQRGRVHFSGGTLEKGGLTGVGVALTLTVRAKKSGSATLSFLNPQVLAHDGLGDAVETEVRTFSYTILENPPPTVTYIDAAKESRSGPTADFDDSGAITLADMSNLAFHLLGGYNAQFDLNQDGRLNLSDLSIFFAQIQKDKR